MSARKLPLEVSASAMAATPANSDPVAGRAASLSARIITDVRAAVTERRLRSGDAVGTEKELAARYGVSRIVARDALRTLQGLGIVEIRMGKGGGARVASGNPRLHAEVLAIQLDLIGVGAGEVIDAQRAVECMAAELAAENATAADKARIKGLLLEAKRAIKQRDVFTRLSKAFHFAVAEASHNRVLVTQLVSLDHVAWPLRNTTLTAGVAKRVLDVHCELAGFIEMRDGAGARQLMDDHMRMIRSRRVAERDTGTAEGCC